MRPRPSASTAEVCKDAKLRRLVKNMIYDGVLSKLLGVEMAQMEHALRKQLGKKLPRLLPVDDPGERGVLAQQAHAGVQPPDCAW